MSASVDDEIDGHGALTMHGASLRGRHARREGKTGFHCREGGLGDVTLEGQGRWKKGKEEEVKSGDRLSSTGLTPTKYADPRLRDG